MATRVQITPPSGAVGGPTNGRQWLIHAGDGTLYAGFKNSSNYQTLMKSVDAGATWELDGDTDWPTSLPFAELLIFDHYTLQPMFVRVNSGTLQTITRASPGVWSLITDWSTLPHSSDTTTDVIGVSGDAQTGELRAWGLSHNEGAPGDKDLRFMLIDYFATDRIQEGGAYATSGFGATAVLFDYKARVHYFWLGKLSSGRSNLHTVWHHEYYSDTTTAVKTDIVKHHHNTILFRPVAGNDDRVYLPFVAYDGSDVWRLWMGIWSGTTSTWSTELVDAEWEPRRTSVVTASADSVGYVYVLAQGEIDSIQNNQAQIYVFTRDSAGSWTREVVEQVGRDVGSSGTHVWSPGGAQRPGIGKLPSVGGMWFGRTDWDDSTVKFWFVKTDNFTLRYGEDKFTCSTEPSRSSETFDTEGSSEASVSLVPDRVLDVVERFESNVLQTEAGYVITSPRQPATRRLWTLRFINRPTADKTTLLTAIETIEGGRGAFTFTEPISDASIKAHLRPNSVRVTKVNPGVYNVELEAEELVT